jgi:hypothetical protein
MDTILVKAVSDIFNSSDPAKQLLRHLMDAVAEYQGRMDKQSKYRAPAPAESFRLTCIRCNHEWIRRGALPKQCPACHTTLWKTPRVRPPGRLAANRGKAKGKKDHAGNHPGRTGTSRGRSIPPRTRAPHSNRPGNQRGTR